MSQTEPATPGTPTPAEQRLDRYGRWLALIANIGVVLGLFALIIEIRQNAELTRVATENQLNQFMLETELHLASPEQAAAWVKSYTAPETMTDIDIRMNEAVLVSLMLQWDTAFQMERAGLRTRGEAERIIRNTAPVYFGNRFGKAWFVSQAPGWQGVQMYDVAAPIVASLDDNYMRDLYAGLRPNAPPASP
jgi:hypothetical protein